MVTSLIRTFLGAAVKGEYLHCVGLFFQELHNFAQYAFKKNLLWLRQGKRCKGKLSFSSQKQRLTISKEVYFAVEQYWNLISHRERDFLPLVVLSRIRISSKAGERKHEQQFQGNISGTGYKEDGRSYLPGKGIETGVKATLWDQVPLKDFLTFSAPSPHTNCQCSREFTTENL